jgi:hypothetical protein
MRGESIRSESTSRDVAECDRSKASPLGSASRHCAIRFDWQFSAPRIQGSVSNCARILSLSGEKRCAHGLSDVVSALEGEVMDNATASIVIGAARRVGAS